MIDLDRAKALLQDHTCALVCGDRIYASGKTGIAPMLELLSEGTVLQGFSAADKIVGKAAALLFVLAKVRAVYGQVMSEAGLRVLQDHGIDCSYGTLVQHIINRKGDGICPMEQTVLTIHDPAEAYEALWETRRRLQAGSD